MPPSNDLHSTSKSCLFNQFNDMKTNDYFVVLGFESHQTAKNGGRENQPEIQGGSAVWYSDMMRMMGIESQVYSMDITHSNIEDRVKEIKPDNVTFLLGDSNAIEKTFTKEFLNHLPHPW